VNKRNYKVDFVTNTIIISKRFRELASQNDTNEYVKMKELKADFPSMSVHTRTSKRNGNTSAKITYRKMMSYFECLPESETIIKQFEIVRKASKNYQQVLNWFNESFPEYGQIPRFDSQGNLLYGSNVIPFVLDTTADTSKVKESATSPKLAVAQTNK